MVDKKWLNIVNALYKVSNNPKDEKIDQRTSKMVVDTMEGKGDKQQSKN